MPQFDLYQRPRERRFLLDCQSDTLDEFETRFVVPLVPIGQARRATRLHPVFEVDGEQLLMVTQQATAVRTSSLGRRVSSLADERHTIIGALDVLLTGV